jgi:cell wall-associated NlpC family hydrolase
MNKLRPQILLLICLLACQSITSQVSLFPDSSDELTDTLESVKVSSELSDAFRTNITRARRIDSLVNYAYTFLGDRYRRGGTGAKGFDCSGFTLTVFKKFGIKLPHTSAGQGLVGYEVNLKNIMKGDLILFRGRNRRSRRIGHVGIVISEKGQAVRFIHSSTSEGVRIDRLDYDYYKKRYVKAVRLPDLHR